jgi:hypothetical protein
MKEKFAPTMTRSRRLLLPGSRPTGHPRHTKASIPKTGRLLQQISVFERRSVRVLGQGERVYLRESKLGINV